MKIPNPWPRHQHIRFNVNNGECLGSCGEGPEIEVPDTAVEVLIEPVDRGRYDSNPLAPGRIWSKKHGMLDVEDHLKKAEIKKEEAALSVRQETERRRKQEEAKAKKVKERTDEMYKDVPEGMLVDPVTGAKKEATKVDQDVKSTKYGKLKHIYDQEKAKAKKEKAEDFDVPKAARFHDVKKEKRDKIDVDHAASGLAKVTKALKPKK